MSTTPIVSKGLTVSFSDFSARITDMDGPNLTRAAIDTTHQGTSTYREFIPSPFVDQDEISVTCQWNGALNQKTLIEGAVGTLSITFPAPSDATSGASWSVSAFVTAVGPTQTLGELVTGTITFKPTGSPSFSAAS